MFPVQISDNQIRIGENWTIICPLQIGHNYHIYFYGSYVDTSSTAKTDYNVYVYDPEGNLESSHTQSAGARAFSDDDWNTSSAIDMQISNQTICEGAFQGKTSEV